MKQEGIQFLCQVTKPQDTCWILSLHSWMYCPFHCLLCDHAPFFFRFVEFVSGLEVKQNTVAGKY